jgi:hypothetical protein
MMRNYETTSERCDRVATEVKEKQLERLQWNEKLRPKLKDLVRPDHVKSMEKHLPMRYQEVDDHTRIAEAIAWNGESSLKENFDLEFYQQSMVRKAEPSKWKSATGFSYKGQYASHVGKSFRAMPKPDISGHFADSTR